MMTSKCLSFSVLQKNRAPFEKRHLQVHPKLIDFASNDYLGFAHSDLLKQNICKRINLLEQIGSTGSRLLTGNHSLTEDVEKRIATYHHGEKALLFPSGYQANVGLFSSLPRDETIAYQHGIHASIRDGMRLSGAKAYKFETLKQLEALLKKGAQTIAVESIDSVSGNFANLDEISHLSLKYNTKLIVDEAHATATFGPGLLNHPYFARIHTFSKALGCMGAAIVGSCELYTHLINYCRPFIYTTAPSSLHLIAIDEAYKLLPFPYRFKRPIKTLKIGCPKKVRHLAQKAKTAGFLISALTYPTTARGEEAIRITFHNSNTQNEVNALYEWLHRHGY